MEDLKKKLGVEENTFEGVEIIGDVEIVSGMITLSKGPAKNREIDYMEPRVIEED